MKRGSILDLKLNLPVYAMWHPKEKHVHTYHLEN